MIDKQIRAFVEYNTVHRRVDNAGKYGKIFKKLSIPVFISVTFWHGVNMRTDVKFNFLNKKVARTYNSWATV